MILDIYLVLGGEPQKGCSPLGVYFLQFRGPNLSFTYRIQSVTPSPWHLSEMFLLVLPWKRQCHMPTVELIGRKARMMGQEDRTMTKSIKRKWFSLPIRLHPPHHHKEISYSMLKSQLGLSQHSNRQRKQTNKKRQLY